MSDDKDDKKLESVDAVVDSLMDDVSKPAWTEFDLEMAQDYYTENFEGMSRSEVRKVDGGFYKLCYRKGWMEEVFPPVAKKVRSWKWMDTPQKARKFYEEHFPEKIKDNTFIEKYLDKIWILMYNAVQV